MRAAALILATLGLAAPASAGTAPHAPELSEADAPPTVLRYLRPDASATFARGRDGHNCRGGGWFSETQAYRWDGRALGQQRWTREHDLTYWPARRGRVTFDGITFHNDTHQPVLVAAWCD